MTRWVAMIRGVNVGGGNKLPMAGLRASCEAIGFTGAATYVQSGNAVFDAGGGEEDVVALLRSALMADHGLNVPVIVRRADTFVLGEHEIFVSHPNGAGRSRLGIEVFERAFGVTATARNLNTVRALIELAGQQ